MRSGRLALIAAAFALAAAAQEDQRSSLQITTDDDGDVAVVMDTESIRMTILPAYQACVSGFIFKPTGNDILSRQTVKFLLGGQGLLQDNFWEQDWRYSEFRRKWFDYRILSQGPDELAVKFWTTSEGWLQAVNSGVKSELLSNIRIERTVRMPVGKPYFMCDVTLSIDMEKDRKGNAKMPQFWMHNMCIFTDELDQECQRPHILGIAEQTPRGQTVCGDYVYAPYIAEGWSAQTSPRTREGLVFLMDPAYVQCLYNCGNSTVEWFGDNMLITRDRPLRTRIYILPVIGLQKVHFADPHMIVQLTGRNVLEGPNAGAFELDFAVCPSYRVVRSITFDTTATYGLHERRPASVRMLEPMPSVRNLRIEAPRHAAGLVKRPDGIPLDEKTPLKFDIAARVEVVDPDGRIRMRVVKFQYFHLGAYPTGKNEHLQGGEPLALLDRVEARPWIPAPAPDLRPDRGSFRLFAVMGPHGRHYRLPEAFERTVARDGRKLAVQKEDLGYTPGFQCNKLGLTEFPYDFRRLFGYRALINCNAQTDITRLVGQSILASYIAQGGGYVMFGGESAYAVSAPEGHPLNAFDPVVYESPSIELRRDGAVAQIAATEPNHPIFKGNGANAPAINLSRMPVALSWHKLRLKKQTLKPFIRDPGETFGLQTDSLPEAERAAVSSLPPARITDRNSLMRSIYQGMSEDLRARFDSACASVFKSFPPGTVSGGVFDETRIESVTEDQKFELRSAFADLDDEEREQISSWMEAAFSRVSVVRVDALEREQQEQVAALLRAAIEGEGVFVKRGNAILLPEERREALSSLLLPRRDELPAGARPHVLMEVRAPDGTHPFLVELEFENAPGTGADRRPGRVLAFLNSPFGDPSRCPQGAVPYWEWDQWPQLVANALMYAAGEL